MPPASAVARARPAQVEQASNVSGFQDHVLDSVRAIAKGLAHDINSPLQVLSDATFLLREGLDLLEAGGSTNAAEEIREAGRHATQAFDQLRELSKTLAHLVPPAESDAPVRLEIELGIVRALTRHNWHRDIALALNTDPRINIDGVPRPVLRQLLIDLVQSVVADVIESRRSELDRVSEPRQVVIHATENDGRVYIEVAAEPPVSVEPGRPPRLVRALGYEPLLESLGVTTALGRQHARAELRAAACPPAFL